MWPALKDEDFLSWSPVIDYKVGDVILFRGDDEFVIHRIIKIDENQITTKGDRSTCIDDTVLTKDKILGKITDAKSSKMVAGFSLKSVSKYKIVRYIYLDLIYLALL